MLYFQIHDVIILFLELINFEISDMISSLFEGVYRLTTRLCWLDASFGFDIRFDWLNDRLNKRWIGWIRVRLVHSVPSIICASVEHVFPNIIWILTKCERVVCIKIGEMGRRAFMSTFAFKNMLILEQRKTKTYLRYDDWMCMRLRTG